MDEEKIINAFKKVKEEMDFLNKNIVFLKNELFEVRKQLENSSTQTREISTHSTHSSTHDLGFKPLNPLNSGISIGNQGASTDRQTDRQTDRHIKNQQENTKNSFDDVLKVLDSLNDIKKEIRLKFKRLTEQEFLVFSTIYQLEEEVPYVNYNILSKKLNLTESSIRDYIGRLIKKGVPIEKNKINNKNIQLKISQSLRKNAPLSAILQLRGL
jgi:predicted  nucleic acid-binding Zn-ribbon protein|tara:strand:+ start:21416 stop:22054 length:639 start_codon:yes stop_codon:yes gene_type:complete